MKLINPQPMDTLPEIGKVFVLWEGEVLGRKVDDIREYIVVHGVVYTAWSYTATTKEDEDEAALNKMEDGNG